MKKMFGFEYEGKIDYFRIENDARGVSKMRIMFKVKGIRCGVDINFRSGKIIFIGDEMKSSELQ